MTAPAHMHALAERVAHSFAALNALTNSAADFAAAKRFESCSDERRKADIHRHTHLRGPRCLYRQHNGLERGFLARLNHRTGP